MFLQGYILEKIEKPNIQPSDVSFVSSQDSLTQEKIKNITGYNWTIFINADGDENSKTASLLFLLNEIVFMEKEYDYVNKSFGINKKEWNNLNLKELDALDKSKKNMVKLVDNMIVVKNFMEKSGISNEVQIKRLQFLRYYFNEYGLPEGSVPINTSKVVKDFFVFDIVNYDQFKVLLISEYNAFLRKIELERNDQTDVSAKINYTIFIIIGAGLGMLVLISVAYLILKKRQKKTEDGNFNKLYDKYRKKDSKKPFRRLSA